MRGGDLSVYYTPRASLPIVEGPIPVKTGIDRTCHEARALHGWVTQPDHQIRLRGHPTFFKFFKVSFKTAFTLLMVEIKTV